jgi:L-lactate dehydrogenase complex protein LldF
VQVTSTAERFVQAATAKATDLRHRAIVQKNIGNYWAAEARGRSRFADWEEARRQAAAVKWEAINHLDRYLEEFERNVLANGGYVHWAETGVEACRYVTDLARRHGIKRVVKAKSMVTEEIHLNAALAVAGVEPIETDLGEFICQLRGEPPYHIVTPVMHLSRADVAQTFHEQFGTSLDLTPEELAGVARVKLREAFQAAGMGVTGANFIVAETGMVALTTNEGNGRLTVGLPPVHVVIVGMEKIVPRVADLALFWPLLSVSGTGQALTVYNTLVGGPRRDGEPDGPREFHVVLLDNGRSRLLANPEQRDTLHCIRCGSCLNVCPIYKNIGGHAYGTTYQGPIGSVITPTLRDPAEWGHLPQASSLCGNCTDVCPVKIDLHHHLLQNRRDSARRQPNPKWLHRLFQAWRWTMESRVRYELAGRIARWGLRLGIAGPLARPWVEGRELPAAPRESFREWWRTHERGP